MSTFGTPIGYVILFCRRYVWVHSFIDSDLSETDNIVLFETATVTDQIKKVKMKALLLSFN